MLIVSWSLIVILLLAMILLTSSAGLKLKTTGISLELNFLGRVKLYRKEITFRPIETIGEFLPYDRQITMELPGFMSQSFWEKLQLVRSLGTIAEEFRKRVHCTVFKLHVDLGVADPALTGIGVGLIYCCQGLFLQALYSSVQVDLRMYKFEVTPRFDRQIFAIDLDCIFTISVANIIIIALKNLRLLIKTGVTFQP